MDGVDPRLSEFSTLIGGVGALTPALNSGFTSHPAYELNFTRSRRLYRVDGEESKFLIHSTCGLARR